MWMFDSQNHLICDAFLIRIKFIRVENSVILGIKPRYRLETLRTKGQPRVSAKKTVF